MLLGSSLRWYQRERTGTRCLAGVDGCICGAEKVMFTIGALAIEIGMSLALVVATLTLVAPGRAQIVRWLRHQAVPLLCGAAWLIAVTIDLPILTLSVPALVFLVPIGFAVIGSSMLVGYSCGRRAFRRRGQLERKPARGIRAYA